MSTAIVVTPAMNYESFMEGDNPLEKMVVFTPDTPEEFRATQVKILRKLYQSLDFYLPYMADKAPQEPKFTLKDLEKPARIEAMKKAYDEACKRYEEQVAMYEEAETFLAGKTDSITDAALDNLWQLVLKPHEEELPQVYIIERSK